MRKLIAVALALSAIASSAHSDEGRLDDLASCLAFAYVRHGLDGVKEVPADLVPGIMAIKDEFLFEASIAGLDDDAAQTMVVERLQEQNKLREANGEEDLTARYLPLCRDVAESLGSPGSR